MIQVDRLTKYFGHVLAVNNVSFQVEQNEIVGLLGNNGAGKTTIMRILTTYLPASSGVARVAGFDVMKDSMEVRRASATCRRTFRFTARCASMSTWTSGRSSRAWNGGSGPSGSATASSAAGWRASAAPCSARCPKASASASAWPTP